MRYSLEPNVENMLKDMAFCHLQENLEIKNLWMLQQRLEYILEKLLLKE